MITDHFSLFFRYFLKVSVKTFPSSDSDPFNGEAMGTGFHYRLFEEDDNHHSGEGVGQFNHDICINLWYLSFQMYLGWDGSHPL